VSILATDFARALHLFTPSKGQRVQGRPGGRMHPGPHAQRIIAHAREPQVQRRHSGLPCAAVYGLLRALPGEPAFATVARANPLELRTTLAPCLCAPEPHGFTVRLHAARQSAQPTSAAFRSTFVTIAIRPLCRCGMRSVNHVFRKNERTIFLRAGLDRANQIERTREIRSLAQAKAGCNRPLA
jgi:hypothetical protein